MAIFHRILLASDLSEASGAALRLACALARDANAELTVFHSCELPPYASLDTAAVDLVTPLAEMAEAQLNELMAKVRESCPGAKAMLRAGVPWEQIVTAAAETGADVIVMGTHGRRGFAHAFIGSVAERVVQMASVPVLTIRAPAAPRAAAPTP